MGLQTVFSLISILASVTLSVDCVLQFDSDDDLKLLIIMSAKYGAQYDLNLDADLPLNRNNEETAAYLLKSLAFIPLKDQKCHSDYVNGFPAVDELKKPPTSSVAECKNADSALPDVDFIRSNIYFIQVDMGLNLTADDLVDIQSKCKNVTERSKSCGFRPSSPSLELYMCEMQFGDTLGPAESPTAAVDMIGFLAQVHSLKPEEVYMRVLGKKSFVYVGDNQTTFDHPLTYDMEIEYPRILWPSWVNTHLILRSSYHICLNHIMCINNTMDKSHCANVVKSLHQLSLTYTYYVCRILSGLASDGLCPDICRRNPCKEIAHAVPDTCIPVGFRIHRKDFFCFCDAGYRWEYRNSSGSVASGLCVKSPLAASSQMLEPCTRFEMEAFCSSTGTENCTMDRLTDNRKADCKCKPDYAGLDCAVKETDLCAKNMSRGKLLCRSHEGQGVCKQDPSRGSYTCECYGNNMRWLDSDGYERCRQWKPSKWLDRAISCGYEGKLDVAFALREFCSLNACNDTNLNKFLNEEETGRACNENGKCVPEIQPGVAYPQDAQSYCECQTGFSGVLCDIKVNFYPSWTQWTVCYDREMVTAWDTYLLTGVGPEVSRVSLRYKDCELPLKRFDNGSVPWCLEGRTEVKRCPALVTDRPNALKATDYGFASQAVISMWRVVEIILLLDGVLVAILGGLLFYQNLVLADVNLRQPVEN